MLSELAADIYFVDMINFLEISSVAVRAVKKVEFRV